MKNSFLKSLALHMVIIFLIIFGLPHFKTRDTITMQAIPIEIVDIGAVTNIKKKSDQPEKNKPHIKPEDKPSKPVEEEQAQSKPKPPQPPEKQEEKPKEVAEVEEKIELPEEKMPVKEEPKKEEEKKKEEKITPPKVLPKKVEREEPKKEKKKQEDQLASVLKNINNLKSDDQKPQDPKKETKEKVESKDTPDQSQSAESASALSDHLSITEEDALRRQLMGCWNLPSGVKNAEDLNVDIRIEVNPDRTVRSAEIVDQYKMVDPTYRAAAESARRAVLNPKCSPLLLPENKFDQWKKTRISFNPKDVLTP